MEKIKEKLGDNNIILKEKETNLANDDCLSDCFTFRFNYEFIFYNFKTSLKNIFSKNNYLKQKSINFFFIIDVIAFKKSIVLDLSFIKYQVNSKN